MNTFALKSLLYPQPPAPPRTRTKPMRLLCVGLSRSATESLSLALTQLGYTVYHSWDMIHERPNRCQQWTLLARQKYGAHQPSDTSPHRRGRSDITAAQFDELMGHADVVMDLVGYVFAGELIDAYPAAKVILNYRGDVDAWARSMDSTLVSVADSWSNEVMRYFSPHHFWLRELVFRQTLPFFFRSHSAAFGVRHCGKWVYKEHCDMVRGALMRRGECDTRLLEWKVEDGWGPLCRFVGMEVPKSAFPRSNDAAGFNAKRGEITRAALADVIWNALTVVVGVFTLAILASVLYTPMSSIAGLPRYSVICRRDPEWMFMCGPEKTSL